MADVEWWAMRGKQDAQRGKGPLFRNTRARGIEADGEAEPPFETREEEQAAGEAYLAAYNATDEQGF